MTHTSEKVVDLQELFMKLGNELLKTLGRSTVSIKKGQCLMPLNALPCKHVMNSQWTDFLENIMSMAKKDLRIKRSATEVEFNGNNYMLDFFHMMLLDLKSEVQDVTMTEYYHVECLGVVGVEFPLFPSSYIAIYRCLMNYNGICFLAVKWDTLLGLEYLH
ncbi:hypothetical protein H5410_051020 [Solanum commersonii]|uniref:RCD1 WWE domain-containing protein n=1 Tax=Solanum commersonii TaxID=4109 RepID=A0A9J5WX19_SOLCO|nr:hypothetical protein H5410_051020 [Solanum commersonii]